MNSNLNMANMSAMGGPVGAPVPMMNNGGMGPQAAAPRPPLQVNEDRRTLLNTYIYEYFVRYDMYDLARALLNSGQPVNISKDGASRRRDENGNVLGNGLGDDTMDTDSKDDIDVKLPDDLPAPKIPMPSSETSFLFDWFCLFWDIFQAQRSKTGAQAVNQYVSHTQQQSRMRQSQQQELLRNMRPDMTGNPQYQMMRHMQHNGGMGMNMKQGNLARTAIANNQNNPQMQMLQQAKQNQMQRDPSDMDGNRQRPGSPASTDNAPSPSKRPRLGDGTPFNPGQPGMMPNGRPAQGMPGQQVGNAPNIAAQQLLVANGINPASLTPQQFQSFSNQPASVQQKSIATYAANLQQHQASQMPNKAMPNAAGPHSQGSPMMPQGNELNAYYNASEMAGPGGIRPVPGSAQAPGGSNHALQDYQMQLMLLEQQNKKRLMMARQEQDNLGGAIPRSDGPGGPGGPGAPPGPNGQQFPEASPQGARAGASPNPTEQMKRGTPQMNNAGIPSPLPEGAASRGSPNPMNFIGAPDPINAPNFFNKGGVEGMSMVNQGQMNGMRPPPNGPPGQPFAGGPMNPQQMMARQAAAQGNPQVQWQGGPNGNQMVPGGPQGQVQGTPQQRAAAMPPPSAPAAAAAAAAARPNTSSPQQSTPQPPTPQQANKPAPKKKTDSKAAKDKRAAAAKKGNANVGATPAAEPQEAEPPTPATPMTPVNNTASFNKAGQAVPAGQQAVNGPPAAAAPTAAAAPAAGQSHADPAASAFSMDNGMVEFAMDFADPMASSNVLNDFDFDSFLHDGDPDNGGFDFGGGFTTMEGGEIGATD